MPSKENIPDKIGLLLPKPEDGEPERMEKIIEVEIHRGGQDKPPVKDVWSHLAMQFQWKEAKPAAFYTENTGGDSIQTGTKIPKNIFKLEEEQFYKGSIWYEGGLDSDDMAAMSSPPKVKTAARLIINETQGKITVDGKLESVYLVVDANRDGEIAADSSEVKTTQGKPFRFWVNNDFDRNDEDKLSGSPDWKDGTIQCIRDLEDFARLKMLVKGQRKAIIDGKLKLGLEWKDASGNPAVQIFPHIEEAGSDDYLKDEEAAETQLSSGSSAIKAKGGVATIGKGKAKIFPTLQESDASRDFENDGMLHLLFEGSGEGKGRLSVVIFDEKEKKLGEGVGVWLDLKDVKKMYISSEGNAFDKAPLDEAKQTVVFVHGWNMSPEGSRNYAETMFKRLWHRGFKGRFAYFRWNTDWGDAFDNVPVIGQAAEAYFAHYNNSEYEAWTQAVPALKSFVQSLPYSKNIAAHSMGNIVVGEAMRLGMTVNNYALMQPSVPAACYDERAILKQTATYQHIVLGGLKLTMWDEQSPDDDSDEATRNISYRGRFKNIEENANLTLFYQSEDNAIYYAWEINNDLTKPPGKASSPFFYERSGSNGRKLSKYKWVNKSFPYPGSGGLVLELDYYLTDRPYEAMSFACRTWGKAAGAENKIEGAIKQRVNLGSKEYQLPKVRGTGFGDEHSGQFKANIQNLKTFYDTLMKKLDLGEPNS